MLDEYEFYHGAVLRQLILESDQSLTIRPFVREGRVNAYVVNGRVGLYVKHSSKRMSPWRFTFTIEQAADLLDLETRYPESFMILVCETDGIVTLDCLQLHNVVSFHESENAWIRVERPPRAQYDLGGNKGELGNKLPRGMAQVVESLQARSRDRYVTR